METKGTIEHISRHDEVVIVDTSSGSYVFRPTDTLLESMGKLSGDYLIAKDLGNDSISLEIYDRWNNLRDKGVRQLKHVKES